METQSDKVKLLLTTVFKPYGVADGYADALGMQMELLNNQITREQGVHSPRANFWTFPLYFLAENIAVPCVVLDFPSWRAFTAELAAGYTHVGISFIQTNVMKARRMTEYIRRHHPEIKILIGGYGVDLPDIRARVPCDEVCPGEGIRWLRRYFGEDPDAPVRHPIMHGVVRKHLYGSRTTSNDSAVIFPGLGCENGCFFCSTSNKFSKQYIPILRTGRDVFRICREAEKTLGVREFAVIDENFLKSPARARELLAEMEAAGVSYNFWIFSSAEIMATLGVDFLLRLGVCAVWVGIETSADVFGKMRNVDVRGLIAELQSKGISVISSSILFMEHHDRETLEQDIAWAIGFGTDMHQFMQLTPLAGTPLYEQYRASGKLKDDVPVTQASGQSRLNFRHPVFSSEETAGLTREAFRRKYRTDGPAVVGMAETALRGYRCAVREAAERRAAGVAWNPASLRYDRRDGVSPDAHMERRIEMLRRRALEFRPVLLPGLVYAPNAAARRRCRAVMAAYADAFGRPTWSERAVSAFLVLSAAVEFARILWNRATGRGELVRQPPTRRVTVRA